MALTKEQQRELGRKANRMRKRKYKFSPADAKRGGSRGGKARHRKST